jgi:hypothetical protein
MDDDFPQRIPLDVNSLTRFLREHEDLNGWEQVYFSPHKAIPLPHLACDRFSVLRGSSWDASVGYRREFVEIRSSSSATRRQEGFYVIDFPLAMSMDRIEDIYFVSNMAPYIHTPVNLSDKIQTWMAENPYPLYLLGDSLPESKLFSWMLTNYDQTTLNAIGQQIKESDAIGNADEWTALFFNNIDVFPKQSFYIPYKYELPTYVGHLHRLPDDSSKEEMRSLTPSIDVSMDERSGGYQRVIKPILWRFCDALVDASRHALDDIKTKQLGKTTDNNSENMHSPSGLWHYLLSLLGEYRRVLHAGASQSISFPDPSGPVWDASELRQLQAALHRIEAVGRHIKVDYRCQSTSQTGETLSAVLASGVTEDIANLPRFGYEHVWVPFLNVRCPQQAYKSWKYNTTEPILSHITERCPLSVIPVISTLSIAASCPSVDDPKYRQELGKNLRYYVFYNFIPHSSEELPRESIGETPRSDLFYRLINSMVHVVEEH